MVLTPFLTQKQIFKRQLSVISLHVVRGVDAGNVESIADRIKMESDDSRSETN